MRYACYMYNKLFTKILDSSVWLESDTTRLIWFTFLAAMDEDGMCAFASIRNLAHRARVAEDDAQTAVERLEAPDLDSSDPENEGRRVERVPGGWLVLNAAKYRELVTREVVKEKTRLRVAAHREKKRGVTQGNAPVTHMKRTVTPSEAVTDTASKTEISIRVGNGFSEGKNSSRLPTTLQSKRVATIFHRRHDTAWTAKEVAAYKELGTIPEDDLAAVERYYAANWPPQRDKNVLRHDLLTFLNNFPGELGRAQASPLKSSKDFLRGL